MVAHPGQQTLRFKISQDLLPRLVAVQAGISAGGRIHVRRLIHHADRGQALPLAQSKIVGVVRRRHLHRAGAEVAAHPTVGHDGNLAPGQRQAQHLAVQVSIALVVWMYRYGYVAQHGFRPRGGDGNKARFAHDGVANLPQLALLLLVDHFQVRDSGLAARAPVDDIGAAIDQPLFMQPDEGFAHGRGARLVHGEVFARPVDAGAQPPHLVEDGGAVMLLPLPDALHKGFAAQLLARFVLFGELPLHHQLGGNAGVVGARQPESEVSAHAAPPGEDIHLGVFQHVPHVQPAGHIGRGQQHGEHGCGRSASGMWLFK